MRSGLIADDGGLFCLNRPVKVVVHFDVLL